MRNTNQLIFVIFFFALTAIANAQCELSDQIEVVNVIDKKSNKLELSKDYLHGIENGKLEVKASVNGNNNTNDGLDSILLTIIPEEEFRSDLYNVFEVNFVITPESDVRNLFLTSEILWFSVNSKGSTMYEEIAEQDPMEAEMTKSMFAYIDLEKINEIKSLIKAQKWLPGQCEGSPVSTLMTITLNDIALE